MEVTIICQWCSNQITVVDYKGNRKFCSRECRVNFNRSPEGRARYKGLYADTQKRCWQDWYAKNRKPLTNPDWRIGRAPWNKGLSEDDPRVAAYVAKQRGSKRAPLSDEKKAKMRLVARRGPANHKWKGGITAENAKWRQSQEYKDWRLAVLRRDRFACQNCGAKSQGKGSLIAHHLKAWHQHPELRFAVDNGQTLCRPCHAKVDDWIRMNRRGWGLTR